ncbi:MAG: SpoIIE family protein phosphatase [Bacteroidetes bacterium]|nr:SpoIIE family protein phosphatase [Bacteroidota bacterium]
MLNFRKKISLLFLLLLATCSASAINRNTIGVPLIRSFDFSGSGLRTNWSIVQDKRGVMFFGVQGGVLEFNNIDGTTLILLPNGSTVRSLCSNEEGIIFVGGRQEIGYLKPNDNGALEYKSLVEKLDSSDRNFTEVAKVYNTKDGICFQAFEALYFFKDGKFKVIKSSSTFHFSYYINDILYVLERGVGLDKYENGRLSLLPGGDEFSDDRIYSILPIAKNKLLFATRDRGLFLYDMLQPLGKNILQLNTPASDYLAESQVYDGVQLEDSSIIYGTLQGGLVILNQKAEIIKVLNKSNILEDNKVNDLYVDNYGDLWMAQDNNVSILEINSPFTFIKDKNGINGNIQGICKFENRVYVATTLGAYFIELNSTQAGFENNPKFNKLDLKSECFSFLDAKIGAVNKLFVATTLGFFEIQENKIKPILQEYCFFAFQSKIDPNKLFVGLKNGFAVLTLTDGSWEINYPDQNIKDEIKTIAEDHYGNIWLVSVKEGVYKVTKEGLAHLNSLGTSQYQYEKFDTASGLPDVIYNKVFPFEQDVIFGTKDGFFNFNYRTNRFDPFLTFNQVLDKSSSQIVDFAKASEHEYIVLSVLEGSGPLISILEKKPDGNYSNYSKQFRRMGEVVVTAICIKNENTLWMSSTNNIICADQHTVKNNSKTSDRLYNALIRNIRIGNDSIIFYGTFADKVIKYNEEWNIPTLKQPRSFLPEISFRLNSISFAFSYSFNEPSTSNYYSYYLEGFENEWKPWSLESKVSYNNLREGKYTLHLKAKNIYDTISDETTYEFVILPPWYRTIWAYLAYLLLFAGFVYLVVQVSVRRLKTAKLVLENTVKERTSEIVKQSEEIQKQKDIVEIKNKDITDSINYAKRIQDTILPPDNEIKRLLPESFILFLPKDILSGDFYWVDEIDDTVLVAAVDCTGHGVPGALMSIVGNNILSQSINEHRLSKPSAILDELNKGVTNTLRQKNEESKVKDGMDIVLLSLDKKTNKVAWAGANNPIYHIRNGELTETKGNKFPIGIFIGEELKHFDNHEMEVQKGDTIYLFTDGYADQFGGPKGKKFKYNQFKITLIQLQHLPMEEQRMKLLNTIRSWQGENEQVDDILVIGIKI